MALTWRPSTAVAMATLVGTIMFGVLAGRVSDRPDLANVLARPSERHWMGTDELGRDVALRTTRGAALSLATAGLAWGAAVAVGLLAGGYAGLRPEAWGAAGVRGLITLFYTTPFFVVLVAVGSLLGPGPAPVALVLALVTWAGPARQTAAVVEGLRGAAFVVAGRALGYRPLMLFRYTIFPEVYRPVIAGALAALPEILALDAALSLFGLGPPPPTPAIGRMILDGVTYLSVGWWMTVAPVAALALLCFAIRTIARDIAR